MGDVRPTLFFGSTRSLRVLFVFPRDRVLTAIAEASAMWGGMYNPIITSVDEIPQALALFRPEAVVVPEADRERVDKMSVIPTPFLHTYERDFPDDEDPRVSVTMRDAIVAIFEAEFKFARSFDVGRALPVAPQGPMQAYWMVRLGAFTDPTLTRRSAQFKHAYESYLRPEPLTVDAYEPFDDSKHLGPIQFTSFDMVVGDAPTTLVVLDPTDLDQVLCLWNLRALGWRTISIAASYLETATTETVDEYPIDVATQAIILADEPEQIAGTIRRIVGDVIPIRTVRANTFWEDVRPHDVYPPRCLERIPSQSLAQTSGGHYELRLRAPRFLASHAVSRFGGAQWVNVIRRGSASPSLMARFQGLDLKDHRLFGTLARINPMTDELAAIADHDEATAYIRWPTAFDYARARLTRFGFSVERGPLASVIDAALDVYGLDAMRLLASPHTGRLWLRNGQGDRLERWRSATLKATEDRRPVADRWLNHLVTSGLLALGAFVRCESCSQSGWVALEQLGARFRCELCSRESAFPRLPTNDGFQWGYRRSGPLAPSTHARSCVSIMLTMYYLSHRWREATWTGPMLLKKDGTTFEVDAAIELPSPTMRHTRWTFLEAKTDNELETKDFDRMRALASATYGCAFMVATLRDSYGEAEKRELVKFAEYVSTERHGVVCALTANELFADDANHRAFTVDSLAAALRQNIR